MIIIELMKFMMIAYASCYAVRNKIKGHQLESTAALLSMSEYNVGILGSILRE